MSLFGRKEQPSDKIKRSILNRLRNTTTGEVTRWADNAISGLGRDMQEAQKSLNRSDAAQALMYLEDARNGALTLLAAIQVLEERVNQQL